MQVEVMKIADCYDVNHSYLVATFSKPPENELGDPYMINPFSMFFLVWNFYFLILIIILVMMLPYQMVFDVDFELTTKIITYSFAVDILACFNTALVVDGKLVTCRQTIILD